jgi:RHS repeat-associated protein
MDLCTPAVVVPDVDRHHGGPRRWRGSRRAPWTAGLALVLFAVCLAVAPGTTPADAATIGDILTHRLNVEGDPYTGKPVNIDLDASTIAWSEAYRGDYDRYWALDRQGTEASHPDPLLRELRAPGIPTGFEGKSDLSGDGRHFTATYSSTFWNDFGPGCNVDFLDGDVGIQYWHQQIIRWSRTSPDGDFDDPELITLSDEPTSAGCDDDAVPPSAPPDYIEEGPPLMGRGANDWSYEPTISEDGEVIAFSSQATDMDGAPVNAGDTAVYVWREGEGVEMITDPLDGPASEPVVSGDGSAVVFSSTATDVVPESPDDGTSIYLARYEDDEWEVELVSTDDEGNPATNDDDPATSTNPTIDHTGDRIAFLSDADNLDPQVAPASAGPHLVVRDFSDNAIKVVRNQKMSAEAHHIGVQPGTPTLSADGERLAIYGRSSFSELVTSGPPTNEDQLLEFDVDLVLGTSWLVRSEARIARRPFNPYSNNTKTVTMAGPDADYLMAFASATAPLDDYVGVGNGIYLATKWENGPSASRGWHGDPVDTANGGFTHHETDLTAPPGAGLVALERSYSSYGEASGVFGRGWMSTVDTRLEIGTYYGSVVLLTPDGQRLGFASIDDNDGTGPWVATGPTRETLTKTLGGDWKVTSPSGAVRTFDELGRLTGIEAPGQPAATIAWNPDPPGQPLSITSATGYSITFEDWSWDWVWNEVTEELDFVQVPQADGRIDRASTSDGRQVDFGYTDGTLTSASRPHAAAQAPGSYGVRTYEHEGGLITRIVDQVDATRTKLVVENVYDAEGRVREQTTDTGDVLTFSYGLRPGLGGLVRAAGYTTVANEASGDVTVYQYNERNEVIAITDALGNVSASSWVGDQPDGGESRSGVITDQVYDDAGRLVEVTETAGATTRTVQELTYVTADSTPAALTDDRIATVTDEAGVTTTFTYDGASRQPETMSVPCDPDTADATAPCPGSGLATTTFTYETVNGAELVASTTDPDGVVTELDYGPDGEVVSTTTYDGATPLVTSYDTIRVGDPGWTETNPAAVEVRTTESPGEAVAAEVYDAEGRLIETRDPLFDGVTHLASVYTYSLDGVLTTVTDPGGRVTTHTVAHPGDPGWSEDPEIAEVTTLTGPDGVSTITKTDRSGDVVVEQRGDPAVPAELATTTHTYGPLGRLESSTDPMGVTTTYEYDIEGRMVAVVDEDAERIETDYDAFGRPTVQTDQLGETTTTTYDAAGRVTAVEDREGHDTTYTYDDAARPDTTTDARGGVVERTYTLAGRVASETDATGRTTTYTYDTAGRQIEVELPSGATTTTDYDLDGRVATVTSPEGRVTSFTYDALGRTLSVADPGSGTTTTTYTPSGEVATQTDATGSEVTYTYDGGRVETVTDALERTTTYTYDSRGNRTKRIDALLGEREWHWNLADQIVTEVDPLHRTTSYTYDDLGRLETRKDGANRTETLGYDAAGRVVSSQFGNVPVTFTYDGEGRRTTTTSSPGTTTWTYDEVGNMTAIDEVGHRDLTWAYDLAGRRTEVTLPTGQRQRNRYDLDGRLGGVEEWDGSAWVETVGLDRDDDGLLTDREVAGGMDASWALDPVTGRVTTAAEDLGGTVRSTDLTYDAAGRIATEVTAAGTTTYDYDDAGQLTVADRPGTGDDETFAYDELGRRTTSTDGTISTSYTWNAASQLTSRTIGTSTHTYTYDGSGRRTRESWDGGASYRQWGWTSRGELALARLVTPAGTEETSRYLRGDGRILSTTTTPVGGTARTTTYAWDTSQAVVQPVVTRIGTNAVTATYAEGLARVECTSTTLDCEGPVAHDALGSAVDTAATDDIVVADDYDAYGDPDTPVTEPAFGYRSELHKADLIHLRARDYDAATGTFLRPDPLDGVDGTTTVANPYHYADNDPVNKVDPLGLRPTDRGPEEDCFDRGGNLFVSEPVVVAGEDGPLDGCLDYDPCGYDGLWGLRHAQRWSCENQETLTSILQFIGSFAAGSFCAILAGPVGWAAAGAAGGACGGIAYRYMDNARNQRGYWDGVFDPKAIAIDAAIGIAVAGVFHGAGVRWGRGRGGSGGGGACSFSAETRVLMADGSTKPISEVEVGDEVWATDPESGESGARTVEAELPHTDQLLTLETSSGDIVTTEDHQYWNETDGEWQGAQRLDEGDRLRTSDGTVVTVEGLDWTTLHTAPAYDLDVAGIDTFYVATSEAAVLVHNCDPGLSTRGIRPIAGTRVRPPGLPESWRVSPTNTAGGVMYTQPGNQHSWVRVMQGRPNSPYPNSREPYVRWQRNGATLDVNGDVVAKNSEAAHIPLDVFRFLPHVFGG